MAKKIDLRTDPHALDSSLDLPDFDLGDIEGNLTPEAKNQKSRSPVIDVFKGSIEGAKDKFRDPGFLAQVTRDSLPRNYGKIFDTANSAAETTASLYNDAVKELKPQVARIAKRVDSLVPAESKRLKGLTTKIKDYFGDEAPMPGTSKEEVQDASIQQALGAVFDMQEDRNVEREARDNTQKRVTEQLESNRFDANFGLLSGIREGVLRTANYTEKVNQAWQRKSLELQYRSYFAQAEMLSTTNRYFEIFSKQQEAIAKNTALPEFVKIKNSERFKEMARTKFIDSVQNSLFGPDSVLNRGFKKIAADAKEYIGGIKQGLEAASMGIDAVEAIQEQNKLIEEIGGEKITAAKLAGNAAGQWGVNKLGSIISDKFRDKLNMVQPIVNFGARASNALTNPGGAINSLRDSESFQEKKSAPGVKGKAFSLLDRGLSYFTDQSPDMRINNPLGTDAGAPEIFNGKTQRSITEVIPGYLARILREIYMMRSGEPTANLVTFDSSSGKFLDKAIMAKKIRSKLSDSVKRTGFDWRLQSATNDIFGRDNLQDQESVEIKKFFANIAKQGNLEFTPEKIQRTETFKKLSPELQTKIKNALESHVGDGDDKHVNQYKLTQSLSAVRDATPDIRADIERFINDGHAEILEDEGIIKQDKDGSYIIDEEKYYEFVQSEGIVKSDKTKKTNITKVRPSIKQTVAKTKGLKKLQGKPQSKRVGKRHGLVKSDETTKENIHPLSPRRALNAIKNTGVFDWFYKKGEGPQDPKRGPMAQDVQRTMGNDAAPGGKQIDLTTMNGNNMAAIQALNERQEKMLKGDKSQNYLEGIYGNTTKIMELLETGHWGGVAEGGKPGLGTRIKEKAQSAMGSAHGYGEMAGNLVGSVTDLLSKAGKDLYSSAKTVGGFTKDKIIKPGAKKAVEFYDDHKQTVKDSISRLLSTAGNFASRALTTAQDVVFNQVPRAVRAAAVMGNKLKNALRETLNKTTDIYVKGRKSPVLMAELMKAGYYIDSVTGKAIENMDDLRNVKGDIKNRAGRTILRIEDAAKGLFDSNGNKVRSSFEKIKEFAWGVAKEGFGRAKKFWQGAAEMGKGAFDKLKGKAQPHLDKLKAKAKSIDLKNPFSGMSMPGLGFGNTDKIYDVLVEIRDLMRGDDRGRHEDGYESSPTFIGPKKKTVGEAASEAKTSILEKAKGLKDKAAAKLKGLKSESPSEEFERLAKKARDNFAEWKKGFVALHDRGELKDAAKAKVGKAKAKAKEISEQVQNSDKFKEAKERVQGIRDRISKRIEEGKERNEARKKEVKTDEPESRYKSGTNVIDKAIGIGSSLKDKFTAMGGKQGLKDRATGALASVKGAKGVKGKLFAGATGIASLFTGSKKEKPEEQQEDKMTKPKAKKAVEVVDAEEGKDKKAKRKRKAKLDPNKETAFNDTDGNGRRDGSFRDRLEEAEERNKARKHKVVFNEPEAKYKGKNVLDNIMDKIKGAFDFLTSGLGSIFDIGKGLFGKAGKLLGLSGEGGLLGGAKSMLGKLFGGGAKAAGAAAEGAGVAGAAAKAGGGLFSKLGTVAKVGGKLLGGVGTAYGAYETYKDIKEGNYGAAALDGTLTAVGAAATFGGGSAVLGAVGTAVTAVASVISLPVILGGAALAALGYGAYKLYKYATRDKINEYEDIRMKQYGIATGGADLKYNHFMLALEDYLCDGRVGYDRGKAYILDKKVDAQEVLEMFSIDKNDAEQGAKFGQWFQQRFKPFFLTNMTALFSVDNKAKLSEVDKLPDEQKIKYLSLIGFESGPYTVTVSPFKDFPRLNPDKAFALNSLQNLIYKLKGKAKKADDKKTAPPTVKPPASATPAALVKKDDKVLADAKAAAAAAPKPTVPQDADKKKDTKNSGLDAMQQAQGEDGDVKESKTLGPAGTDGPAAKMSAPLKEAGGPQSDGKNWSQYVNLKPGVSLEGMNPEMLQNLKSMVQEYGEKTGKKITLNSGARSMAEQEALYRKDPKTAAPPGRSLHEFGLAFDAQSTDVNALDEMGLMRKYGFTRPVGGETWHVEPAGIQVDIQRAKKDSMFADTAIQAGLFKGGGGIGSVKGSAKGKRDAQLAQSILFNGSAQKVSDSGTAKSPEQQTLAKLTKDQPVGEKKPTTMAQAAPAPASAAGAPTASKTAANSPTGPSALPASQVGALNNPPATDTKLSKDEPKPTVPEKQVKIKTLAANNDSFSKMEKLPDIEAMPTGSKTSDMEQLKPIDINNPDEVKKAIADISTKQGQDPKMMTTFAAVESSLKPNAKGGGTSEGLYGFTKATWDERMSKDARRFNIPESTPPTDVRASTIMASQYVRENKAKIQQYKANPTLTDIYLTHFLGPTGSRKFLTADPNANAANILPNAAAANKAYFYENGRALTVSEVYQKIDKKLQKVGRDFGVDLPASKPPEGAKTARAASSGTSASNSETIRIGNEPPPQRVPGQSNPQPAQDVQVASSSDRYSTARAPEVASAPPIRRQPGYGGPGASILTPQPAMVQRQPAQDSFSKVDSLVDIGTQQLDVQKKMLELLQTLAKNSDPEVLKQALESLQGPSPAQPAAQPRNVSQTTAMPKPAVDNSRKVA